MMCSHTKQGGQLRNYEYLKSSLICFLDCINVCKTLLNDFQNLNFVHCLKTYNCRIALDSGNYF